MDLLSVSGQLLERNGWPVGGRMALPVTGSSSVLRML